MALTENYRKMAVVLSVMVVVGMIPMVSVSAQTIPPVLEDDSTEEDVADICGQVFQEVSEPGDGVDSLVIARNDTLDPAVSSLVAGFNVSVEEDGNYCIEDLVEGTYHIVAFPVGDLPGERTDIVLEETCVDEEPPADLENCDDWELLDLTGVNIAAGNMITV